jgi:murein DD-endopeptidase MepM/ murein hydrolase activator NlpD
MIGNLWERGTLRLPEVRSVILRSVIQGARRVLGLIQTQRAYAVAASAVGITVVAVTFAGIGYVRHARHADDAELAVNRVETANIDLQDELARLRDKVAASNRDLAAAQGRVVALAEEERARAQHDDHQAGATEQTVTAKGDKLAQMTTALHQAEAQRATLAARLSKAEADLSEQQAKQSELQAELDQWQKKLQQLTADHDKAVSERDRLRARVGELEKQSQLRHSAPSVASAAPVTAPSAAPVVVSTAAPAPAAESPQRVAGILNAPAPAATTQSATVAAQPVAAIVGVSSVAHGAVDQFARVLASAGVDVRHLFDEFGVNRDTGGPFVPAPRGQTVTTALNPDKLAAMIKSLPVAAPLTNFEVSSPFGVREDPENGRGAFHTGIDLRAPYDTPVYATAPGTVTFAGWRDDYGKIVEIDHGNGIATRYAHLHAFTVSVGQRVAAHQQVGYLGSSGRATGPHVHYEVVVNGEPQDPEKFFGLARYVPSMAIPVAARN